MDKPSGEELKGRLEAVVKGEVAADEAALAGASHDASMFVMRPQAVVSPKDAADIGRLVRFAAERRQAGEDVNLTVRSAGTDMGGGALGDSVIVSMTPHFDRIISVTDKEAVTQPGVYYRDFEQATLAKGALLPSYPASRELCTVGGMVANNSGGELTLTYGKTADYVRGLKMVLRDGEEHAIAPCSLEELDGKKALPGLEGELYRGLWDIVSGNERLLADAKPKVSKNSAGYALWDVLDRKKGTFDMTRLMVGSQGTLGIVTEIRLGLVRPKSHSRLLVIFLRDMKDLAEVVPRVLERRPQCFESYDDHTFRVALKVLPDMAKRMRSGLLRLGISFLPEFGMLLTGGVPKLVLIAQFAADDAAEAEAAAEAARRDLEGLPVTTKVTRSEREGEKYWIVRRESFNLLRHHVHGLRTAPFIDDFAVRPERMPEFLPELYAILDRHPMLFTIAGHVGDGNFHVIPLMDLSKPGAMDTIRELEREVYGLVVRYGGSITGEHNDGLVRTPYLELMFGKEVTALFARTKRLYDPDGIFNPRKKVGLSLDESFGYVDTSPA